MGLSKVKRQQIVVDKIQEMSTNLASGKSEPQLREKNC